MNQFMLMFSLHVLKENKRPFPPKHSILYFCCCWHLSVCVCLLAMLQDGGNGGAASPEARLLEGLESGVGDGGEAERGARHPGDIIEAARLLVTRGYT